MHTYITQPILDLRAPVLTQYRLCKDPDMDPQPWYPSLEQNHEILLRQKALSMAFIQ